MSTTVLTPPGAGHCRAALPHSIVARSFVAETVLLDIETGRYFKLEAATGGMLDAVLAAPTVGSAARWLAARGWGAEDRVVTELLELCAQLERHGLLRLEVVAG